MSFQADEPPQTVEWYTPPSIFKMLGCCFTLDPCHPGRDVVDWVPALSVYTKADAVLFLKKRVRFVNADGVQGDSPNCGSMLVAWGDLNVEVLRHVEHGGHGVLWRV